MLDALDSVDVMKKLKTPSHSTPRYVVVRVRQLLAAKGWPLSVLKGRYEPFGGGTQRSAEGFRVSKIGCGKHVAVTYTAGHGGGRSYDLPRDVIRARTNEAIEYLRLLGYRIDERGWIQCDAYDDCDR